MNNPNPFVPQGSLLELQSKRRSRLKLAVLCVLVVGVAGLTAMLIQGCKREQVGGQAENPPPVDTNMMAIDTNMTPMVVSNPPVPPPMPMPPPMVENAGMEYVVVSHDTLGRIARRHGVTLKALEDANPGINPNRLKVGQKLTIPAGGTAPGATGGMESGMGRGEVYVVKPGDNLTKIAKTYGTTIKAIQAENNLSTTHIQIGQKLKIPAKAEAAVPPPAPAPVAAPPLYPAPAPAPGGAPSGQ